MQQLEKLPGGMLEASGLEKIDYWDAFKVEVSPSLTPAEAAKGFFESFPGWVKGLMMIREKLAGWVGLKTAQGMDVQAQLAAFKGEVGQAIALFQVWASGPDLLVFGERDKHLNFALCISLENSGDKSFLTLSTLVEYTGPIGPLYFTPVKQVHLLIMPILARRIALASFR